MTQIRDSVKELRDARDNFNLIVNREFDKITDFTLLNKVKFADRYISHIYNKSSGKTDEGHDLDITGLDSAAKFAILEQYYGSKQNRSKQLATQ
jgi:hypothetical protein